MTPHLELVRRKIHLPFRFLFTLSWRPAEEGNKDPCANRGDPYFHCHREQARLAPSKSAAANDQKLRSGLATQELSGGHKHFGARLPAGAARVAPLAVSGALLRFALRLRCRGTLL